MWSIVRNASPHPKGHWVCRTQWTLMNCLRWKIHWSPEGIIFCLLSWLSSEDRQLFLGLVCDEPCYCNHSSSSFFNIQGLPYYLAGPALGEVGEAMRELSEVKDSLDMEVKQNFIDPLQNLHDKDLREIQVPATSYLGTGCWNCTDAGPLFLLETFF